MTASKHTYTHSYTRSRRYTILKKTILELSCCCSLFFRKGKLDALLGDYSILDYARAHLAPSCELKLISKLFGEDRYGLGLPKDSPLKVIRFLYTVYLCYVLWVFPKTPHSIYRYIIYTHYVHWKEYTLSCTMACSRYMVLYSDMKVKQDLVVYQWLQKDTSRSTLLRKAHVQNLCIVTMVSITVLLS